MRKNKTPYEHDHCFDCGKKAHGITKEMEETEGYKNEMMCNTCMGGTCPECGKENTCLVYCIDLERAKRAALGERISSAEFD